MAQGFLTTTDHPPTLADDGISEAFPEWGVPSRGRSRTASYKKTIRLLARHTTLTTGKA